MAGPEGRIHRKRVVVLGSTGSIGVSALDVLDRHADRFEVVGLSAQTRWESLSEQADRYSPRWIHIADPDVGARAKQEYRGPCELLTTPDELTRNIAAADVDIVIAAVVGFAGLHGTWAALDAGKLVALANKETLVVAGQLVEDLLKAKGGTILPVDSEHSAIHQAIHGNTTGVERVVLTGSGGPFRGRTREELQDVDVESALKHPTWKMGPKITVDSATLMNKALEVIEARWLFGLSPDQIGVVIHPESMVHSFVEFVDGSVMAQISPPDMRLPIQYALTYPERLPGPARKVDWAKLGTFRFEQPDRATFPALDLGFEVARTGGTSGAVLNAANEAAVERFLRKELPFLDIARVCRDVLEAHTHDPRPTLDGLTAADRWARSEVQRWTTLNRP